MQEELLSSTFVTSAIGLIVLTLLYWYLTKDFNFWKKNGIVQAKAYPLIGSELHLFRNMPQHEFDIQRYNKLGKIFGYYEGSRPTISIADPELLRNIFVKDFNYFTNRREFSFNNKVADKMLSILRNEDWKRVRNIITPTFTSGKIKRMMGIFKECAGTLINNFKTLSQTGEPIDTKKLYGAFTMDVIASSAFSTKLDSHNDPNNEFAKKASVAFVPKRGLFLVGLLFLAFPKLLSIFRISVFDKSVMDFFATVVLQIIKERKKNGQVRNDFLQLLMDTAEENKNMEYKENEDDTLSNYAIGDIPEATLKNTSKKNLSQDELVAQCIIFFLAGYDTTSSTLAFATYYLALNQDIQDKLREEINNAIKNADGNLKYEDVQNMKYLDNIISETLRLHPPLFRLERQASASYNLGDTGVVLPKGTIVSIPICAIHRDPEYFPDPERFDPDRFTPDEKSKRDQFSYLPFGAGPRNCVGMRFVLIEIKVCLAIIVRNFRIKKCPQTKVPLEFNIGGGLLAPKEIYLSYQPLDTCNT